jgi:hypothetical protein
MLAKTLNSVDRDMVNRARDIAANTLMSDLAKEDPQAETEYQDAVRHQIVASFQRLRLYLLMLDTLLEAYHAAK